MKNPRIHAVALCLTLVLITELATSIKGQSLTLDEGDQIFAGYESWKKADFGLNPEHPPFVKNLPRCLCSQCV